MVISVIMIMKISVVKAYVVSGLYCDQSLTLRSSLALVSIISRQSFCLNATIIRLINEICDLTSIYTIVGDLTSLKLLSRPLFSPT